MNWPKSLLDMFNMCHKTRNQDMSFEERYYGPYNTLLNYALMDDSLTFFVSPQRAAPYDLSQQKLFTLSSA
jgi:hypothetical protein